MLLSYLDDHYEVERIVRQRTTTAGVKYEVEWKGGGLQWVAASDLNCPDLLLDFNVRNYFHCYYGLSSGWCKAECQKETTLDLNQKDKLIAFTSSGDKATLE